LTDKLETTIVKQVFNEIGLETYIEQSDGAWLKTQYDDYGRVVKQENSYGEFILTKYLQVGIVEYTSGFGDAWDVKTIVNKLNNSVEIQYACGNNEIRNYDNRGKLISYYKSSGTYAQTVKNIESYTVSSNDNSYGTEFINTYSYDNILLSITKKTINGEVTTEVFF
jgi:hypothetical protein